MRRLAGRLSFKRAATQPTTREALYRGRQVTGLLIVGGLMIAFALARANWHEVFPVDWWNVW